MALRSFHVQMPSGCPAEAAKRAPQRPQETSIGPSSFLLSPSPLQLRRFGPHRDPTLAHLGPILGPSGARGPGPGDLGALPGSTGPRSGGPGLGPGGRGQRPWGPKSRDLGVFPGSMGRGPHPWESQDRIPGPGRLGFSSVGLGAWALAPRVKCSRKGPSGVASAPRVQWSSKVGGFSPPLCV